MKFVDMREKYYSSIVVDMVRGCIYEDEMDSSMIQIVVRVLKQRNEKDVEKPRFDNIFRC